MRISILAPTAQTTQRFALVSKRKQVVFWIKTCTEYMSMESLELLVAQLVAPEIIHF